MRNSALMKSLRNSDSDDDLDIAFWGRGDAARITHADQAYNPLTQKVEKVQVGGVPVQFFAPTFDEPFEVQKKREKKGIDPLTLEPPRSMLPKGAMEKKGERPFWQRARESARRAPLTKREVRELIPLDSSKYKYQTHADIWNQIVSRQMDKLTTQEQVDELRPLCYPPEFKKFIFCFAGTPVNIHVLNSEKDVKPIQAEASIGFHAMRREEVVFDEDGGFQFIPEEKPKGYLLSKDKRKALEKLIVKQSRRPFNPISAHAEQKLHALQATQLKNRLELLRAAIASQKKSFKRLQVQNRKGIEMNEAAYLLTQTGIHRHANRSVVQDLKGKANVWLVDHTDQLKITAVPILAAYHLMFGLTCGTRTVRNELELDGFLSHVRDPKHKNTLRMIFAQWQSVTQHIAMNGGPTRDHEGMSLLNVVGCRFNSVGRTAVFKDKTKWEREALDVDKNAIHKMQGSDFGSIIDFIKLMQVYDDHLFKSIFSAVLALLSYVQCPTIPMLTLQIASFVNSLEGDYLVGPIMQLAEYLYTLMQNQFQGEGDEDSYDVESMFTKPYKAFISSRIGCAMWDLFSLMSVSSVCARLGLGMSFGHIRYLRDTYSTMLGPKVEAETFFQRLINLVSVICSSIKDCIVSGSLQPLFEGFSFTDWSKISETLLDDLSIRLDRADPKGEADFKMKVKARKLPSVFFERIDEVVRRDMMDEQLKYLPTLLKRLESRPDALIRRNLDALAARLKTAIRDIDEYAQNGRYRVQPYGMFIYGVPGCGKSELGDLLCDAFCNAFDYPNGPHTVFHYLPGTNFFDGAKTHQSIIVCDDIDATVGVPTVTQPTHCTMIQKIINKCPLFLEQADVTDKGKVCARYHLALYFTNFKNGRTAGNMVGDVLVFWRRFPIKVEVLVKPEYATARGKLDLEKVSQSKCQDYWVFRIGRYDDSVFDPTNPHISEPYVYTNTDSLTQFVQFFLEDCKKHLDREKERLALGGQEHVFCPVCKLSDRYHPLESCMQGFTMPAPPNRENMIVLTCFLVLATGGWLQYLCLAILCASGLRNVFVRYDPDYAVPQLIRDEIIVRYAASQITPQRLIARAALKYAPSIEELEKKWNERASQSFKPLLVGLGVVATACALSRIYRFQLQGYTTGYEARPNDAGSKPGIYHRVPITREVVGDLPPPTTSIESMREMISRRIVDVLNVENRPRMFGLVIGPNLILVPGHCLIPPNLADTILIDGVRKFAAFQPVVLSFKKGVWEYEMKVIPGENAIQVPGREYFLVAVPGSPVIYKTDDFLKHLAPNSSSSLGASFDEVRLIVSKGETFEEKCGIGRAGSSSLGNRLITTNIQDTQNGDCGSPLIVRIANCVYIGGYHLVRSTNGLGSVVTVCKNLRRMISLLALKCFKVFIP
jgi:hypothetical protein